MAEKTGKLHPNHDAAIPNAKTMPCIDQYYQLYRMGVMMASAPNQASIPTNSAFADNPAFVPYTSEDERILELARKMAGFDAFKDLSHGDSKEDNTINNISPVNTQNVHRDRFKNKKKLPNT